MIPEIVKLQMYTFKCGLKADLKKISVGAFPPYWVKSGVKIVGWPELDQNKKKLLLNYNDLPQVDILMYNMYLSVVLNGILCKSACSLYFFIPCM